MTAANSPRFTWGLVIEVFDVLEQHGYRQGDDRHVGRAVGMLHDLAGVYATAGDEDQAASEAAGT